MHHRVHSRENAVLSRCPWQPRQLRELEPALLFPYNTLQIAAKYAIYQSIQSCMTGSLASAEQAWPIVLSSENKIGGDYCQQKYLIECNFSSKFALDTNFPGCIRLKCKVYLQKINC